jgi:serine/threonine protein kinase/tetratricopeptide (TPR) repeat protein
MLSRGYYLHHRYRIIRPLGQGGFGQVYEALDDNLACVVAIKQRFAKHDSEKMRRAFEREAQLLANLRHSMLPKVVDHFTEGNSQYLVMEFIEGDDLATLLSKRQRPFSVEQVLHWADELLKGLEYLHTRREVIIHRDIKPANIKLTNEGEIFLLDFGLAKGYAGSMDIPETNQRSSSVHGYTAAYASLEQLNNSGTNQQSDIYSLGATLYHLLTGRMPVRASDRYQSIEMDGRDPLSPAHAVNTAVAVPISLVLSHAMAMSRRDRLKSAGEMRLALVEAKHATETAKAVTESDSDVQTLQESAPIISRAIPSDAPSLVPDPQLLPDKHRHTFQPTPRPVLSQPPTQGKAPTSNSPSSEEVSWSSQLDSQSVPSSWASTIVDSVLEDEESSTQLQTEEPARQAKVHEGLESRRLEEELERGRLAELAKREAEENRLREETERRRAFAETERQREEEARRVEEEEESRRVTEEARLSAEVVTSLRTAEEARRRRELVEEEEGRRLKEEERQQRASQEGAEQRGTEQALRRMEENARKNEEAESTRLCAEPEANRKESTEAQTFVGAQTDAATPDRRPRSKKVIFIGAGLLAALLITIYAYFNLSPATTSQDGENRRPDADIAQLTVEAMESVTEGNAFTQQGKKDEADAEYVKAEGLFTRAVILDQNNPKLHVSLASVFILREKYAEAKAEYQQALRLDPSNADYKNALKQLNNARK